MRSLSRRFEAPRSSVARNRVESRNPRHRTSVEHERATTLTLIVFGRIVRSAGSQPLNIVRVVRIRSAPAGDLDTANGRIVNRIPGNIPRIERSRVTNA